MSEIATSPNTRRGLRVFFGLLVVFLYAPIVILAVFVRARPQHHQRRLVADLQARAGDQGDFAF